MEFLRKPISRYASVGDKQPGCTKMSRWTICVCRDQAEEQISVGPDSPPCAELWYQEPQICHTKQLGMRRAEDFSSSLPPFFIHKCLTPLTPIAIVLDACCHVVSLLVVGLTLPFLFMVTWLLLHCIDALYLCLEPLRVGSFGE